MVLVIVLLACLVVPILGVVTALATGIVTLIYTLFTLWHDDWSGRLLRVFRVPQAHRQPALGAQGLRPDRGPARDSLGIQLGTESHPAAGLVRFRQRGEAIHRQRRRCRH